MLAMEKHLSLLGLFVGCIVVNVTPGAIFATLHFLCHLQMGSISLRDTLQWARKVCQKQTL
jgi:hypothetical protein